MKNNIVYGYEDATLEPLLAGFTPIINMEEQRKLSHVKNNAVSKDLMCDLSTLI